MTQPDASAALLADDDDLLTDANAWYSDTQVAEIKRFVSHDRGCTSRKGAHYGEENCDCGLSSMLARERPVTRERIITAIAALATRADDRPEVERLREALISSRDWLMSAPLESGYCCCGSPVDGHGLGDGHSPVDELAYSAGLEIERINAAFAHPPATLETLRVKIAETIRNYCRNGVQPEPFGGSLDTADLAAYEIVALTAKEAAAFDPSGAVDK